MAKKYILDNRMKTFLGVLLLLSTLAFKPPGTKKVNHLYIDTSEIDDLSWAAYVYYQKRELSYTGTEKDLLPDTALWRQFYGSGFNDRAKLGVVYPLIGVSYDQAVAYCKWRSDVVSQRKKGKYKVTYRFPTKAEYSEVIEASSRTSRELRVGEYDKNSINGRKDERISYLTSNLYEYTATPGVYVRGGTFKVGQDTFVTKLPQGAMVGFRCIADVDK